MRLLLDTHAFLWFVNEPELLSREARDACEDTSNSVHVSVVNLWEAQIKQQVGKLTLRRPLSVIVGEETALGSFQVLAVLATHVYGLADLPLHHRDPFDRILIAQARAESMQLVTCDGFIRQYASLVDLLW